MAKFGVKIYGVDAIIKRFDAAPQKMMDESKLIIDAAVIEIAAKAKQEVPVKTGALRGSIRHAKYQPGKGASVTKDVKAGITVVGNPARELGG